MSSTIPTFTTGTKFYPVVGDTFGIARGIDVEFGGDIEVEIHDDRGVVFVVSGPNVILTGANEKWTYKVTAAAYK